MTLQINDRKQLADILSSHIPIGDVKDLCLSYIDHYDMSQTTRCHKCNETLVDFGEDYDVEIDIDGESFWSIGTWGEEISFCKACKYYYMKCPSCEYLLQHIGNEGCGVIMSNRKIAEGDERGHWLMCHYDEDNAIYGSCHKCDGDVSSNRTNCDCYNVTNNDMEEFIPYYVGHLNVPWCEYQSDLTGPNGGFSVYWTCVNTACDCYGELCISTDK